MKIFDNIMSWKKPEMLDLAKELNIKGRSKMNKGEVAESISEILLSDEYFKTVLAALDKEQTECLVNWCENNEIEKLDVPDINVGNISNRTSQLAIFDFRSFLDLAMMLVESQPAKSLRQIMI